MTYSLIAACITIAWVGLFIFYTILSDRQKRLEAEIASLHAEIDALRNDKEQGES